MLRIKRIVLISFLITVLNQVQGQNGFQYIYLDDDGTPPSLAVKCDAIKKVSDTSYTEYGLKSDFHRFIIESKISVQTSCNLTSGTFDTAIAIFEIAIAKENNKEFGKAMVDSIYSEWLKTSYSLQNCFSCSKDNYFLYSEGSYILYNYPGNNWVNSYYALFFEGKFLKVTFKGFKDIEGWGGLSSFLSEICYFNPGTKFIEPGLRPSVPPKDFFILYDGGKFD